MKKLYKWFDLFFFFYWSIMLIVYIATGDIASIHIICSLAITATNYIILFLDHLIEERK